MGSLPDDCKIFLHSVAEVPVRSYIRHPPRALFEEWKSICILKGWMGAWKGVRVSRVYRPENSVSSGQGTVQKQTGIQLTRARHISVVTSLGLQLDATSLYTGNKRSYYQEE